MVMALKQGVGSRKKQYIFLFIFLFILFFILRSFTWVGNKQLHSVMESMSALLSFMVGILALVRYYTKKNNGILFIGAGFLGTSFLDGYHAVVTSVFFDQIMPSPPPSLIPWSWNASRIFLSILMFVSWWAWKREDDLGEKGRILEGQVYSGVFIFTVISFFFFAFFPLPKAYYSEFFFGRPEEYIAAFFFFFALIGYLMRGNWRHEVWEHWIVISLIIGFMCQAMFMPFSFKLFDGMFDVSHGLKTVSYICVLIGLLINMYSVFKHADESEIKIRAIVDSTVDGIIVIDRNGFVDSFNLAAERIFGYKANEVFGKNINMLMPEPYHSEHDSYLKKYRDTGMKSVIGMGREVVGRCKDGSVFPMDLSVSEMAFENNKMFTGIVRDITERKNADNRLIQQKDELEKVNRELKSLDEMKTNFLSTISHELRTPLTSILGSNKLIFQKYDKMPDVDKKQFLKIAIRQGDHLLGLVNDILDVAKAESGHLRLEKRQVDLRKVVQSSLDFVHVLADEKGVSFKLDVLTENTIVFADSKRLQQIFINLVGNAIKFTTQGKKVFIKIEDYVHSRGVLLVSVIDSGIGIPKDKIDILFNRFAQADNTPTRKAGGTGLGLAIVKELVHLHGGRIWVESEEGKGSSFFFTILKAREEKI